jgi:hypothetical protein
MDRFGVATANVSGEYALAGISPMRASGGMIASIASISASVKPPGWRVDQDEKCMSPLEKCSGATK